MSSPTVKLRLRSRLCARLFGRKPRRCAVSRMRSRVSAVIRPCPFSAFEAVATLTPAGAATSRKVTGVLAGAGEASEDMVGGEFP